MPSYLAQGLAQGFQTGSDAYKSKKERELQKKRDEAEKELRQKILDQQIAASDRDYARNTSRDRMQDSRYNEQASREQTKEAQAYQERQLDREIAQGQATRGNRRADRQLDLAAEQLAATKAQANRTESESKRRFDLTQGPGSPSYAAPLLAAQAQLMNAEARKRPTYGDDVPGGLGAGGSVDDFMASDEPAEGTVVEQDGVKYKYTNGTWTPIK